MCRSVYCIKWEMGRCTIIILKLNYFLADPCNSRMADEGEEFVVDKILDKRVRNGKIEYYLSWKVGDLSL